VKGLAQTPRLPGGIPKIIHRIWLGSSMPTALALLGTRWAELHPEWRVVTWHEWNLPALRNQQWFDRATAPAQKADIARLELLYRYGGVYVDTDSEPYRPLDDLVGATSCFIASEDGRWLSTGVVGSTPRHPFVRTLVDGIEASIITKPGAPPNEQTGPKYVTSVYVDYQRDPASEPVAVFPPALFYPYHFSEPERRDQEFPDAYAVHHWSMSWVAESQS